MRGLAAAGIVLVATGCQCGDVAPVSEETPAWAPPPDPDVVQVVATGGARPAVALQFSGVGTMYRGWFSERELLGTLVDAVSSCLEPPYELAVTYDEDTRRGRVVLVAAAHQLGCHATVADGGLDLSALTALAGPLASFRNGLAATRDIRIYGFATALHFEDARGSATLWLEGQDPLDGSAFGACAGVDRVEHCQPGEAPNGITTIALPDAKAQERLAAMLGTP